MYEVTVMPNTTPERNLARERSIIASVNSTRVLRNDSGERKVCLNMFIDKKYFVSPVSYTWNHKISVLFLAYILKSVEHTTFQISQYDILSDSSVCLIRELAILL